MSGGPDADTGTLRRHVGRLGLFALGFGSIVGSAWLVVLGDWLRAAGPGGAAVGFAAGGVAMLAIAASYGELAARMPRIGGEFLYVLETFGRLPGFVVGWFLTLNYVAFAAFEGIALSLLLSELLPGIAGPVLYQAFGRPVSLGGIACGLVGGAALAGMNLRGARLAVAFQSVVTSGFLVFALCLVALGVAFGRSANLAPAFAAASGSWQGGALWIFATAALFLNGFQAATHAVEERAADLPVSAIGHAMLHSVVAATLFYIAIILATAAVASWRGSAAAALPAVAAFASIPGFGALRLAIVAAACLSLAKTWNALVIVGSRLIVAQARAGVLPAALGRVSPAGVPRIAVLAFSLTSAAGVPLGLGGLIPILDTCAVCVGLSFTLSVAALLRHRALAPRAAGFTVPGGTPVILFALCAAVGMALTAAVAPLVREHGAIPLEWKLFAGWSAIGLALLFSVSRRRALPPRPIQE